MFFKGSWTIAEEKKKFACVDILFFSKIFSFFPIWFFNTENMKSNLMACLYINWDIFKVSSDNELENFQILGKKIRESYNWL